MINQQIQIYKYVHSHIIIIYLYDKPTNTHFKICSFTYYYYYYYLLIWLTNKYTFINMFIHILLLLLLLFTNMFRSLLWLSSGVLWQVSSDLFYCIWLHISNGLWVNYTHSINIINIFYFTVFWQWFNVIYYVHTEHYRKSSVTPKGFFIHFDTVICILILFMLQDTLLMVTEVTKTCWWRIIIICDWTYL